MTRDDEPDRLANLLGALAVAAADRIETATDDAAGRGSAAPAALVTLHEFRDGGTVDELRRATGLSPSGGVRLVDRLEADGLVRRRPGRDGREVSVVLTAAGHRRAQRISAARRRSLAPLLDALDRDEQATFTRLLERVLGAETADRLAGYAAGTPPETGWLCRLCDPAACGRPDGRCPVASTAAAPIT
jgi:DNA-binding MarR family transcriptional regulator